MLIRLAPAIFVCLWATGFVGARLSMPYAEPGSFLALRFGLAFAILAILALIVGASWPKRNDAIHAMIAGSLIHGIYLGGVFWAVNRGMPGGISAVLVGLQPLLAAFMAYGWIGEKITTRHLIGLPIGLLGVVLVLWPGLDLTSSGINAPTIVACVLAVLSISLGTVYQKRYLTGVDLRTGTALQYVGAFVPVFLLAFLFENFQITWNTSTLFALGWLLFVLSIAAVFLLMWLIREGSVAKVSSLFFLVPAVAAAMTWFLFGETLLPLQIGLRCSR